MREPTNIELGSVTGEWNPMYESPFPGPDGRSREIRDLMGTLSPTGSCETVITVVGRRNRFLGAEGAMSGWDDPAADQYKAKKEFLVWRAGGASGCIALAMGAPLPGDEAGGAAARSAVVGFGAYYGAWECALRNLD